MVSERSQPKSVCVIGAGPSGLVAARELRKEGHKVVVIEQNHEIGGQWLYDSNVEEEDPLGQATKFLKVHSSMYESLRLASPREIMGFTDFPFVEKKGRDTRRFPGHREVFLYLNDFCEHFGLRDMIRFNTRVEYVGMEEPGDVTKDLKWVVKSKEKKCEEMMEQVFDAVVVASGHYSRPMLPTIRGMDSLKKRQIHSHVYRVPEPFRDEVVVIVGSSHSAQDIAMELVGVAKEVYVSAKPSSVIYEGFTKVIAKHENLHLSPQIECIEEDGRVSFVDNSWVITDTIIYCTGYSYSFPFLDTKGIVTVDDNRVGPLYEHTFPPLLAPSLSFVGIHKQIIAFPFFESQGKWVAQLLSGKRKLPPCEEMLQSIKEFYQAREDAGIPKNHTHVIVQHEGFEYCDRYGDNVGFPHLEEWRKQLSLSAVENYYTNLEGYRDEYDDFELIQVAHHSPHFTQLEAQEFKV